MSITLFILLLFCHFAGGYTHLSRPWMLEAKRTGWPLSPIISHATVHAVLMGIVAIFFKPIWSPEWVICFYTQVMSHTCIDVLKGKMNVWFPSVKNPSNYSHWYLFGAGQTAHILIILLMANILS